jgi:glycosyltransferase involved in cell wall biosynthesis
VHLDSAREWRGGQTQLRLLVRELGTRVEQHVILAEGAPLLHGLRADGVAVTSLAMGGPFGGVRALRAALADLRPDLVAAHTARAHTTALLAGVAPVVVHRRVDFAPRIGLKYRWTDGFVAVSRAVAAVLTAAGVSPDRIRVVHDGVDPTHWQVGGHAPDPGLPRPWILAVGALVAHKGHTHLVDALAELPAVHAVILGEGPLRGALLDRARARGVAHRLFLRGQVDDPGPWYAAADAVVHPSVEEGLGQVLVEALLSGAAVVATGAGGAPEVVGDRGIVVASASGRALADGVRQALADPGRWRDRARNARGALIAAFGAGRMADETLAAWRSLVTPAAVPPTRSTSWWTRRS